MLLGGVSAKSTAITLATGVLQEQRMTITKKGTGRGRSKVRTDRFTATGGSNTRNFKS
jgi:hypothetical protein